MNTNRLLKIVLIEDNADHAELVVRRRREPLEVLGQAEPRREVDLTRALRLRAGRQLGREQERARRPVVLIEEAVLHADREIAEPLAAFLGDLFGRPGLVLHGGTPVARRRKLVESFQRDDGPPFFLLTVKAGGAGLNLTQAAQVIHFDRWWNPAVENQATDRAYRIGQKRNVLVHKFVCKGTLEERIDQMIRDKQELADNVLGEGSETLLTEMTDSELLKFVALDVSRATLDD